MSRVDSNTQVPVGKQSVAKPATTPERNWPAQLALGFDRVAERTRMYQMRFHGPLRVQRPFYPEGDVCHTYLLHPPGGLVSGDDLTIDVACKPSSHALITTPSAGKIYRADSLGVAQKQRVEIEVEDAVCEWLPMETIVFDGASGQLNNQINLYGDAKFIGIDLVCLGRPKSDLPFTSGSVEQRLALYHNHQPRLLERQYLAAEDPLLSATSGFNHHLVSGTLIAFGLSQPEAMVEQLRRDIAEQSRTHQQDRTLSVTYRLGVLVVRYLGDCSEQAQCQLRGCWQQIRPALLGKAASIPRIWHT